MSKTPISDARVARLVATLNKQYAGRLVQLRSANGKTWRAEVLPAFGSVVDKMRKDGCLRGGTVEQVTAQIEWFTDMPVAAGSGVNIVEAMVAVLPVKWNAR